MLGGCVFIVFLLFISIKKVEKSEKVWYSIKGEEADE
jgi:hypothetical protein